MPRISTKETLKHFKTENQNKSCEVKHCDKNRVGVSRFCSRHQRNNWRYGDPLARRIFPREIVVERSKCRHVVEYNKDNPAIETGIKYFQKWMENAANGIPGIEAQDYFKRLHSENVTGADLLVEVSAILLFRDNNPNELPDNHPEPLMMAIGLAVLGYRKRKDNDTNPRGYISELKIKPRHRKDVGRIIWRDIALILIEISKAIQENDKSKGFDRKLEVKLENAMM